MNKAHQFEIDAEFTLILSKLVHANRYREAQLVRLIGYLLSKITTADLNARLEIVRLIRQIIKEENPNEKGNS